MKKLIKNLAVCFLAIAAFVMLSSHKGIETNGNNPWIAPAEADTMINPFKGDQGATDAGKLTFTKMCVVCHGDKGKGDGIAGANLTPHPANFTEERVIKETDGAIYWKLTSGKSPMASYKLALSDEKRWQLVNYIRKMQLDDTPVINAKINQ